MKRLLIFSILIGLVIAFLLMMWIGAEREAKFWEERFIECIKR